MINIWEKYYLNKVMFESVSTVCAWNVLEMKGMVCVALISDVIRAGARFACIALRSGPKAHIPTSQRTTLKSVPAALVRHSLKKTQL